MIETTYIKEVFESMMPFIQAQYDTLYDPVEAPFFMYGRKSEILQLLTEKDQDDEYKYKKYPLIILYASQQERHGINHMNEYLISPLVSIVTDSSREFYQDDRFTNSIKPILYPIYEYLLQEIGNNPAFYQSYAEDIKNQIKVWDGNPSDSKTIGIAYNDYLDGIDVQFTDLRLFKNQTACATFGT